MNNDKNKSDRDEPLSHHVTQPDEVIDNTIGASSHDNAECPLCGATAAIVYGFGDGPQRGRLLCPTCGTVDWPPRAC